MTVREALLRARRRPRHLGAGSPTIYRGDGYEFVELRAYVPGDDVRRIDWAATARSGELQTRVVLEDVALTLAAIVDASPSMRIGRRRPVLDAAREAAQAWFGAARGEDRCIGITGSGVTPPALQRGPHRAFAALGEATAFDPTRLLRTARGALPRGTALLAISDWFDLDDAMDRDLAELGARFDCTALVVRDPWYDELPLAGMVRIRGAEGGVVRAYVGPRERDMYRRAVRLREEALLSRFSRANWRTGILREEDGAESLAAAFGARA
ncbi:MAG: DUF58 domain-containing protein [Candidatus Eremiobacteraeota bacterium]|nr:DUF58 domain-containing protein [Candidatus Eremiobacteraeota bacterium]MBV8497992.1 DUF58 domain-containing protein [Candidatus Eremiobacteraeota bacterium]